MNISEIENHFVCVRIKNEDDFAKLTAFLIDFGLCWYVDFGLSYKKINDESEYKDKVVAYIDMECFGNVNSAKHEGYKVITVREFIKLYKNK